MNDLPSLPPQFAAIRQRILDAEAKGLIVPEIQLDVGEGETAAETAARMERMAGFLRNPSVPDQIAEMLAALSTAGVPEPDALATEDEPTITEHRIAQIRWNPELLIMMGRGRFEVVDNALPDDVEIVSVSTDVRWAHREIVLTVKSESFAVVPEGAEIPMLPPTVIRRLSEGE